MHLPLSEERCCFHFVFRASVYTSQAWCRVERLPCVWLLCQLHSAFLCFRLREQSSASNQGSLGLSTFFFVITGECLSNTSLRPWLYSLASFFTSSSTCLYSLLVISSRLLHSSCVGTDFSLLKLMLVSSSGGQRMFILQCTNM